MGDSIAHTTRPAEDSDAELQVWLLPSACHLHTIVGVSGPVPSDQSAYGSSLSPNTLGFLELLFPELDHVLACYSPRPGCRPQQ